MNNLEILQSIVDNGQAQKVTVKIGEKSRKLLIDVFSASKALNTLKAVNEKNKVKLLSMPLLRMINICMSV